MKGPEALNSILLEPKASISGVFVSDTQPILESSAIEYIHSIV